MSSLVGSFKIALTLFSTLNAWSRLVGDPECMPMRKVFRRLDALSIFSSDGLDLAWGTKSLMMISRDWFLMAASKESASISADVLRGKFRTTLSLSFFILVV